MLCNNKDLRYYSKVRDIGAGNYGKVELVEIVKNEKGGTELLARKYTKLDTDGFFTGNTLNEINNFQLFNNCDGIINFKGVCVYSSNVDKQTKDNSMVMVFGENINQVSLFFEYMDGDLQDWIDSNDTRYRVEHFQEFFNQISKGLATLHQGTITHNDLKTENILVKDSTFFKLADLGISGSKLWVENFGFLGGTATVRAPESLVGRNPNDYSFDKLDLWSFGLCCIYFLTNYELFIRYDINDLLFSIYKHSTVRDSMTFKQFKTNVKDGTIDGFLDVNYIFDMAKLPELKNLPYINDIYNLCNLNPIYRKLPHDIYVNQLAINIKENYYDKYVNIESYLGNLMVKYINMFNMTVAEKVIAIELLFRYVEKMSIEEFEDPAEILNIEIRKVFAIVEIVKKYFGTSKYISEEYKMLSGKPDSFNDICVEITKNRL